MPQVAAHFAIADLLSNKLGAANPAYVAANPKAYKLGAMGPDLSFFLLDAMPIRALFSNIIQIYLTIAEIKDLFEEVTTKIGGPMDDFADWVTGGLSTDISALIDRSTDAIRKTIELTLLPGTTVSVPNPFFGSGPPGLSASPTITVSATDLSLALRAFGHPYSNDPPFKKAEPPADYRGWWWMDILHYRRTGLMADTLRKVAQDDFERAYAQGWFTHVAADVCGHPYVNGAVGGPYRNHVIRHLVIEKIIDTWVHQEYKKGDIITAGLQKVCDVGGDFHRIAGLLNRALDAVYINPQNAMPPIRPALLPSSVPTIGEWQQAFDLAQRYLQLATDTGFAPPVPPPDSPATFFKEVGNSLANTAGNIGGSFSGSNEWWEWLLAPFLAALYGLVLVFKILTLPAGVLTRVLALAPRWVAYELQLGLYTYVRELRWTLTLGGFGFPSSADLTRPFSQLAIRIPPSRSGRSTFRYPHMQSPHNIQGFWLFDPASLGVPIEPTFASLGHAGVQCSPYTSSMLPNAFIEGRAFDAAKVAKLEEMAKNLNNVGITVENERDTFMQTNPLFTGTQFGSSVEFAERLLDPGKRMLGSFDLDGDQGYGFLNWEGPPPVYDSLVSGEDLTLRP